jgi:nitrite reductase/ring-hydroxylating ferredoxin subunit
MSVEYRAVTWNRQKRIYDTVIGFGVPGLVALFFGASALTHPNLTAETGVIRGLGLTALLLLHIVLSIGPLARLDPAFLPLLYNRRHLGVAMALVALAHGGFTLIQFHALGDVHPLVSVLTANGAFGSVAGFPFELLGIAALMILVLMAATSHDFWLSVLTPPVWKSLHMLAYLAYALVVGHVALGAMQAEPGAALPLLLFVGAALVIGLHLAAGLKERRLDREALEPAWVDAGGVDEIPNQRAKVVVVGGERVAVFRHDGKLSCVSNVCRHQNGPLGEGKIVDGCITCPWHGYQYRPDSGTSPPPFNDKVATYNLRIANGRVLVDPKANPPGTRVEPVPVAGAETGADTPFYVGYLPEAPPLLARHSRRAIMTIAVLAGAVTFLLALAQAPFAAATFEYGHPRAVTGRITALPYPLLEVDSGGRVTRYLLAARGKHGATEMALPFDGRRVEILGTLIHRGNSAMFEVAEITGSGPTDGRPALAQTDLGRFTLTGEIVDAKCWLGVMNPGEGKTHLDCAVRCLSGGLPPFLVLRDGSGREEHLLLADGSGAPMPKSLLHAVGRPVTVSGQVLREGDLLFIRADASAVRVLER